jgi:hypothetical protein
LLYGQFIALLLVGALRRIGAGDVERQADKDRVALRTRREIAYRFFFFGCQRDTRHSGQQHAACGAGADLQHGPSVHTVALARFVIIHPTSP